jgi:glycosyltransferase involved in cell wall biosynthesis
MPKFISIMPPTPLVDPACLAGKRIAVVVFSYFLTDPRVFRETSALAGAGAEIDVFCLRKSEAEPLSERRNDINITRANLKKSRAGKIAYVKQYAIFTGLACLWLTRRTIEKRYDIVHVHNMPDFLVFSALPAKVLGAKVILDLHDPMPEVFLAKYELAPSHWLLRLLRIIEKLSISFADLVLTPNLAFRTLFTSRSGPAEKIRIVMNSPLEEIFPLIAPEVSPKREQDDQFTLMYHGTLVERHGLHTALKAFYTLSSTLPGLRFFIFGAKTEYLTETVLPLIEKLGLGDNVQYLGEASQDAIALAIQRCDLGLIPNLKSEFTEINFPTRIFEYLALGKPVLVPETPGIGDYFSPDNMLFFQWGNEEEDLADKIQWVFDHPAEVQALVAKGQEVYRNNAWPIQREAFLKAVSSLLKH